MLFPSQSQYHFIGYQAVAGLSHCLIIVKALAAGAVGIVGVQLCVAHVVANTRVVALQVQ